MVRSGWGDGMKNWKHTQRKRAVNWANALSWQMMLPPESRDEKLIRRLRKRLEMG